MDIALWEPVIRIESVGMVYVIGILAMALFATWMVWPFARRRWMRLGRIEAEPALAQQVASLQGYLKAEESARMDAEGREADMAEKYARLAAWAARGPEVASEPTERQLHMVRGGK